MNLFAYLEDEAPDGSVTVVTEGRLKASLRKRARAPWKMPEGVPWHRAFGEDVQRPSSGRPVRMSFDLMPTSYVFSKGHSIKLTVTCADPRERGRDTSTLAENVSVYGGGKYLSSLALPIIDR